ncbi:TRADD-N-associated membrane domain-containing protein [Streptomyces sp. NPDC054961]
MTQARRTTALSLVCSGLGVAVIVGGAALAVWNAETSGDL